MKHLTSIIMSLAVVLGAGACTDTAYWEEENDSTSDSAAMASDDPIAVVEPDEHADNVFGEVIPDDAKSDDIAQVAALGVSPVGAASTCYGTSSPFAEGPRCCPYLTVLRPWQRRCERFYNLSSLRDSYGSYNGSADQPNTLAVTADTLQVCAMYTIDNGEGDSWPHGPYGNLYVDIFNANEPLGESQDGAANRRIDRERQLRGPHRTHDTTDEWFDDEFQRYQNFGVFRWNGRQSLVVRMWESDGSEDGSWGRRNDVLGMERIARSATLGGLWVPLHKYTNDHPRRRTGTVTGWIYLKTGGTCPR